ncbi:MAG: Trk system potassium transporter TrkA, partial [Acidimicrobiia bacterium]|nr:Trk system potassium transporter TrkA [Acidimicrobiia bacterium]
MRIVIVGAGQVGSHLAERLSIEGQDVVVIESDAARAAEMQASLDALVIHGNGSSREALEEARVGDAKMLIAVTSSDAANILACQAALRFGVPLKIARVEDPELRDGLDDLGVDVLIDPTEALAKDLLALVKRGGVSEIIEYGDGQLVLLGGFIPESAPVAGHTLEELRAKVAAWDWIVCALVRSGKTTIARGDTMVNAGDHVLIMAKGDETREAIELLGLTEHPAKKVMVVGATRLAQLTAELLAKAGFHTTIVDTEVSRCKELAAEFPNIVVVQGDATDPRLLRSEGIENVDALLALTGWDEVNILSSLVANALGVETTVARFHRLELLGLLSGTGLDAAVSTRLAAASAILRYVRRGRIYSVATFQDSQAEAIDIQVDAGSSSV